MIRKRRGWLSWSGGRGKLRNYTSGNRNVSAFLDVRISGGPSAEATARDWRSVPWINLTSCVWEAKITVGDSIADCGSRAWQVTRGPYPLAAEFFHSCAFFLFSIGSACIQRGIGGGELNSRYHTHVIVEWTSLPAPLDSLWARCEAYPPLAQRSWPRKWDSGVIAPNGWGHHTTHNTPFP